MNFFWENGKKSLSKALKCDKIDLYGLKKRFF